MSVLPDNVCKIIGHMNHEFDSLNLRSLYTTTPYVDTPISIIKKKIIKAMMSDLSSQIVYKEEIIVLEDNEPMDENKMLAQEHVKIIIDYLEKNNIKWRVEGHRHYQYTIRAHWSHW